jgi:Nucleotidyltransferase of unknown function (DUF6036)
MKKHQLEHIIRAAGAIAEVNDLVIIGSQAILGSNLDFPDSLLVSLEADIFARDRPELSTLLDGTIGELSPFHQTFGYYAHGVGPETAVLPSGWEHRLVPLANQNTGGVTGWCLCPEDIAYSKLAAGREKDLAYIGELVRSQIIDPQRLLTLLTERTDPLGEVMRTRMSGIIRKV